MISALVAGIGGGSLGTEVLKALKLAGGYRIVGCDISPLAFGFYAGFCDAVALARADGYIESLLSICRTHNVQIVIPGAEVPTKLIANSAELFRKEGIALAINSADVAARTNDKKRCFSELSKLGIAIPRTSEADNVAALDEMPLPCVIKPSVDSGGSAFVFYARDRDEMKFYATYLSLNGKKPIAQEYISHENGEYTVGVLSEPDGSIAGVIAMQRSFPNKLSISAEGENYLISSGISQGRFDEFPEICAAARKIAIALNSMGPLNIQGRVDAHGRFLPFEINPRFSASTYLRATAGFNEIDYFARRLMELPVTPLSMRPGWYLRGVTEAFVSDQGIVA